MWLYVVLLKGTHREQDRVLPLRVSMGKLSGDRIEQGMIKHSMDARLGKL